MENNQVEQFYEDLGQLFDKYGLNGMCGICFEPGHPFVSVVYDPADTVTAKMAERVGDLLKPLIMEFTGARAVKTQVKGFTGDDITNN